ELLIYIAGVSPKDRDALKSAGLAGLQSTVDFPSPIPIMREVATGPGDRPGERARVHAAGIAQAHTVSISRSHLGRWAGLANTDRQGPAQRSAIGRRQVH